MGSALRTGNGLWGVFVVENINRVVLCSLAIGFIIKNNEHWG